MTMNGDTVSVLEGNTFVVGRRNGDVDAGPGEPHGLFHRDTRHLSRWLLTIDGQTLGPLSTDDTKSFSAHFFLVPGTGSEYTDATLSVMRRRDEKRRTVALCTWSRLRRRPGSLLRPDSWATPALAAGRGRSRSPGLAL